MYKLKLCMGTIWWHDEYTYYYVTSQNNDMPEK